MVGETVVAVGTETGEARAEGAVVETYVEMAGEVGVGRGRAGGLGCRHPTGGRGE